MDSRNLADVFGRNQTIAAVWALAGKLVRQNKGEVLSWSVTDGIVLQTIDGTKWFSLPSQSGQPMFFLGSFGIGTSTPVSHLNVVSVSTATPRGITSEQYNPGGDGVQLRSRKARGTPAFPGALQSGDLLGIYVFDGHDGTAFGTGAQLRFVTEEAWTTSAHGTYMAFLTTTPGSTTVTERMRITGVGNVGIGVTPAISDGVGLHLGGKILRIGTSKTPATAGATGNAGEICWDSNYIYVCVGTNSWKRAAISAW